MTGAFLAGVIFLIVIPFVSKLTADIGNILMNLEAIRRELKSLRSECEQHFNPKSKTPLIDILREKGTLPTK